MKTLHESAEILVRLNESDEVFVLHKQTNVEIRISRWTDMIVYAWQNCRFTPTSHNGLSAFLCERKEMGYGVTSEAEEFSLGHYNER